MVRQHRYTETPITTAITDPALIRQMREQEEADEPPRITCECGCIIDARHVERHRRTKKHRVELQWFREQMLLQLAEQRMNQQSSVS
jgi:hypothetical protein